MPQEDQWSQILKGESREWKALVKKHEALVYTVISRMGLSYQESADCFQQTWVLLWQSRNRITDPVRLPGWLATTARREALRVLRHKKRLLPIDDVAEEQVDTNPLPDEELEKIELQSRLEDALSKIDDRCAKLLRAMLLDPEDESYGEIALRFGISANALGPARRRCLDRLKAALEKVGYLHARTEKEPALPDRKTTKVSKRK